LLNPGDRVVVAVSGGPDSVCLLSVLHLLSPELELSLHIAHLDHMFRGAESADEALFVTDLAKRLGLPATVDKFDVPRYCRERGLSPQAGAREARYAFLSRVATEVTATRIATGHTASDQAETFLLRLLRGAGIPGLSAIPPIRGSIIRPLIEVTREEVEEHLRLSGMSSVSDPSNAKTIYTRNRIRLELLPLLKRFNPRIVETLASEAALLRDEDAALESCVESKIDGVIEGTADGVAVNREEFNALPLAFRRRFLKKAVDLAGGASSELSRVQIDEAVRFLETSRTGRTLSLPSGMILVREYDRFLLRFREGTVSFSAVLEIPGKTAVPELGLEVESSVSSMLRGQQPAGADEPEETGRENYLWQATFDYDKIDAKIVVRNRTAGDRFCPSGMQGKSKKLQDFFVDARIPRRKRDAVPLLASGDAVLWVMGLRLDERFGPGPDTKHILTVTVRRTAER
jgi:tRNA(Ile)-lysidine synthase